MIRRSAWAACAALTCAVLAPGVDAAAAPGAYVVTGGGMASPGYDLALPAGQYVSFTFFGTAGSCGFSGATTGTFFVEEGTVTGTCDGIGFTDCRYVREVGAASLACPPAVNRAGLAGHFVWRPVDINPTTQFEFTGVIVTA